MIDKTHPYVITDSPYPEEIGKRLTQEAYDRLTHGDREVKKAIVCDACSKESTHVTSAQIRTFGDGRWANNLQLCDVCLGVFTRRFREYKPVEIRPSEGIAGVIDNVW